MKGFGLKNLPLHFFYQNIIQESIHKKKITIFVG